ncbi:hypothetical protein Sste5346_001486 [Sporothrix stenoceras]|uniref:Uncharacterized protein n=1 Tax=Sporothrix stenoceras TaxID=5173 RepID=A0ABR3ZQZ3_9PEZI
MGTELIFYLMAQQLYILLTPAARDALVSHLKSVRTSLQQQVAIIPGWVDHTDAKNVVEAAIKTVLSRRELFLWIVMRTDGDGDAEEESESESDPESAEGGGGVMTPQQMTERFDPEVSDSDGGSDDEEFAKCQRIDMNWQAQPVALRRDKLGLDMERINYWPDKPDLDDGYGYNANENGLPIVTEEEDDIDDDDGEGAPCKTWNEAMANAPEENTGLYDYFLWEKKHKRRALAVMKRNCLPWVPYLPMAALPTKEM